MTRYVLNSGGIKRQPNLKKQFHQEIIKSLSDTPKILICSFAQPREDWESKFGGYSSSIAEDMSENIRLEFALAMPDTFAEQSKWADILYFNGGDDHLLQFWMKQFDLPTLFKNKVVATNSASSDMLATHYWTCDWRQCADGLSVLPIKLIPHFKSELMDADPRGPINWKKAYSDLQQYGDTTLPIHALKEGEFIIVEQ